LLAACAYSREVWLRVLRLAGLAHLAPAFDAALIDWWLEARSQLPRLDRRGFDSITLLVS